MPRPGARKPESVYALQGPAEIGRQPFRRQYTVTELYARCRDKDSHIATAALHAARIRAGRQQSARWLISAISYRDGTGRLPA